MKKLTLPQREALRESFRPERIRLLFIGEAPPASGRFFYSRNSGLYRAMREAFAAIAPLLRAIASHVERSASRGNWHGERVELPYPGRWLRHRRDFVRALEPTLRDLLSRA